jgi:hypothetical protein
MEAVHTHTHTHIHTHICHIYIYVYIYIKTSIFLGCFWDPVQFLLLKGTKVVSELLGPQMPLLMEYDNLETKSLAMRCDLRYLFLGKSGCKSGFKGGY